jgi:ferredoxin
MGSFRDPDNDIHNDAAQLSSRRKPAPDARAPRGGRTVNVFVDETLCQGHARCNLICPEVFGLDEDGFAAVLTPQVPAAVRDAVLNCPEQAIKTS